MKKIKRKFILILNKILIRLRDKEHGRSLKQFLVKLNYLL